MSFHKALHLNLNVVYCYMLFKCETCNNLLMCCRWKWIVTMPIVLVDFVEISMVFLSTMSSSIMVFMLIDFLYKYISTIIHCIFNLWHITIIRRSQNQLHWVWQQTQSPPSKWWMWGPLWRGRGISWGFAGVMQGVCEFFCISNSDTLQYKHLQQSNVVSFVCLLSPFSKPPVTRSCVQSPGAPAPIR